MTAFHAGGSAAGGSGVVVLPCGAGKTMVGIGVMAAVAAETLILTTNIIAVRQWLAELLDKTDLDPSMIGEYTGERKEIRPVTVTTYQILTWRRREAEGFPHLELFGAKDWGLIIYDEVHLLPARGLPRHRRPPGAAAARADRHPRPGGRAGGRCLQPDRAEEVRRAVEGTGGAGLDRHGALPRDAGRDAGRAAPGLCRGRATASSTAWPRRTRSRTAWCKRLVARHADERILVIGQYLAQLRAPVRACWARRSSPAPPRRRNAPGSTRSSNAAAQRVLVVSKVANFALDLPEANVAIQVSGTFGSRQEEAQRLGRILRPKADGRPAHFYAIVTRGTRDQDFAFNRQLFLAEQGYRYTIEDGESG